MGTSSEPKRRSNFRKVGFLILFGLPAFIHILYFIFKLIPGDQPDRFLRERALPWARELKRAMLDY